MDTPRVLLPYPVLLERSSLVCFVLFCVGASGEGENSEEMTTVSDFLLSIRIFVLVWDSWESSSSKVTQI